MAFLLLLHEKMRLKRQVNKLTLKQLRYGGRLDRMTKSISRVQKMYSARQAKLEQQAKMMQSQANCIFQNMMGLGTQNQVFNPMNMSGNSMTTFVLNQMGQMLAGSHDIKDQNGEVTGNITFTDEKLKEALQYYSQGQLKPIYDKYGDNGSPQADSKIVGYGPDKEHQIVTKDQFDSIQKAYASATYNQQQAQMMTNQMSTNYQNNISVWLEAEKAQLEAEQDAALAPLELEQTDMELEKESVETQLEYARARLEGIEQACKEGIKDSAPRFGLG